MKPKVILPSNPDDSVTLSPLVDFRDTTGWEVLRKGAVLRRRKEIEAREAERMLEE